MTNARNAANPIKRVSVVSTGSVSIHPEHVAATRKPLYWWLFTSRRWTQPLPINVYVIEHRDGLVLFDTGQDRASVTDPDYFPGGITGVMYDRLSRFDIAPEQTLTSQLAAIGYDIGDVHTAVVSHLHQDHIGGLRELTGAQIVVSRREWQSLGQAAPELRGLLRSHIDLPGLRWRHLVPEPLADRTLAPFTTGHDLFDDGSMVLLPTPGHTPGSLSMLVRGSGRAPLLMVGDLTYDVGLLERGHVPGVGEKRQLSATTEMINQFRLANPGLTVLAAHDPSAAPALAGATSGDLAAAHAQL
ncbi:N-acyl homoserine lactonase family protein [Nonomuraea sp. CA-141351]|uniref:N-acyl homoserine lactonase family protein n=1 Tax=Nonomuraea sp. CA-141351 TaxID=3239996 RepID=UPI003D8FA0DA